MLTEPGYYPRAPADRNSSKGVVQTLSNQVETVFLPVKLTRRSRNYSVFVVLCLLGNGSRVCDHYSVTGS